MRNLFVDNIDKNIDNSEIKGKFNQAFSNEAEDRVFVECIKDNEPTNRNMIVELKLNLKGMIESDTLIANLFKNGKTVSPGCPLGQVNRAGFD
ncbi:MAG TPA: hypothetical protein V6C71_08465 [Coleofasciculaceae cyanobacterium]